MVLRPSAELSRAGSLLAATLALLTVSSAQAANISWKGHTWNVTSGGMAGVCQGNAANVSVDASSLDTTDESPSRQGGMPLHHRRSIRLKGYDYTRPGMYFVTICAQNRETYFGHVIDGVMTLSQVGQLIEAAWTALPKRFPSVELDDFSVMPNHVHGIVVLIACPEIPEGAASCAPTTLPRLPGLGDVVRAFKSVSTVEANRLLGRSGRPLWQRNYYEHIIRNEHSLDSLRQYIANNPARWAFDRENPEAI